MDTSGSSIDEEIRRLEMERKALLARRPARLVHPVEPKFGSVMVSLVLTCVLWQPEAASSTGWRREDDWTARVQGIATAEGRPALGLGQSKDSAA